MTLTRHNPYGVKQRGRGRSSDIHDPEFRSAVISFAATGVSRRAVAALCGKPESTIRGWIERGMAYPDIEPWASFSEQYQRAERGLELAGMGTANFVLQRLWSLAQTVQRGQLEGATPEEQQRGDAAEERLLKARALKDILTVVSSRFPADIGTSKHRQPEPEYSAANWLDENSMDREQMAAVFSDPPEEMRLAMVDAQHAVYAILIAGGFDPSAPKPKEKTDEAE